MQKVCSAKAFLCLPLSTYLVLQQLSLSQTKPKPLNPILQKVYQNPKYICRNIFLARYFCFDLLLLLVVCLFDN